MNNQLAYVDEFGTNALEFGAADVHTHFIVSAVLVGRNDYAQIVNEVEAVRRKHFQTGEIKSSKVAQDDSRRLKILRDLRDIKFHVFCLVVDKREIVSRGLEFKKSFYKYINGLLYSQLFRIFPDLQIFADEVGGSEFKKEFAKYVMARHVPDLFNNSSFTFQKSNNNVLIQLADFISGTLARCFDIKLVSPRKSEFLTILEKKILVTEFWPVHKFTYVPQTPELSRKYDPTIAQLGINLANDARDTLKASKDVMDNYRLICIRHLIFHFSYISPNEYVWKREIVDAIENRTGKRLSDRIFMTQVIGRLRSKGVIISSSSKGYKLPANEGDLYAFLKHSNSIISPMIDRIRICRNAIKAATKNELDILDNDEFKYLKLILDS